MPESVGFLDNSSVNLRASEGQIDPTSSGQMVGSIQSVDDDRLMVQAHSLVLYTVMLNLFIMLMQKTGTRKWTLSSSSLLLRGRKEVKGVSSNSLAWQT